jgi:hypothetical protein
MVLESMDSGSATVGTRGWVVDADSGKLLAASRSQATVTPPKSPSDLTLGFGIGYLLRWALSVEARSPRAAKTNHSSLPLKSDDGKFKLRWLGMFNENNPSATAQRDFRKQAQFADLFFHWNISVLLLTAAQTAKGTNPEKSLKGVS